MFYDRKENCLTKYYCIQSRLTVFETIFVFLFNKKYFYQTRNDLNTYNSGHLESIFTEIICQKNLILVLAVFTDTYL